MTASVPIPIDDAARDGRNQLVLERPVEQGGNFALVRWSGDSWIFPSGAPLPFEPTLYQPRQEQPHA